LSKILKDRSVIVVFYLYYVYFIFYFLIS
jgi:hypothetical protein